MDTTPTQLDLLSFLSHEKDLFHIVRRTITSTEELAYHNHNYAEIFWIKEGRGIHLVNGQAIAVEKGHLCMIRPNDTHTFRVEGNNTGLVVTNVAFFKKDLDTFNKRYFPDSTNYFQSNNPLPFTYKLNTEQLNEISSITDYIIARPKTYLQLDLLVLHLFKILDGSGQIKQSDMPYWLQYAIEQYQSPHAFRNGVAGFTALCQRSTDHVNRVIKLHLNQTLTETVTRLKINYAAQRLTMTNIPIKTISHDCGFKTIGHFYKVFKKYQGMTPKAFREHNYKVF